MDLVEPRELVTTMNVTPRNRRIVRTTVLVTAGPVLLVLAYFRAYVSMHWLLGRGWMGAAAYMTLTDSVFTPAVLYAQTELPCAYTLRETARYANHQGMAPFGSGTFPPLNPTAFPSTINERP
jgi:hypothetical protein